MIMKNLKKKCMKLNNIQKRLKLCSMLLDRAEIELNKALFLAKDEPIKITMEIGLNIEKLTELKKAIWNQ